MTERELLETKRNIEEIKPKISELKGERLALMKQLKENWGCSRLEEAEKKRVELKDQQGRYSEEIEIGMSELEEKLNAE